MDSNNKRSSLDIAPRQTPFEKSLSKRIEKAYSILSQVSSIEIYSSKIDFETVDGLNQDLQRFEKANTVYFELVSKYLHASLDRKKLFQGDADSLKETAYSIKKAISKNLGLKAYHRKNIKSIYALIYAQNPLGPPYDFAKPSLDKEMNGFLQSYVTLLSSFKLMVEQIRKEASISDGNPYSLNYCERLIVNADTSNKSIERLIQKIYVANDERLAVFERIKERCASICNRSRFLFGPNNPHYKLFHKLKLSMI